MTALVEKLKQLHTFYSTYVMYFLTGVAMYWLQLPPDQQQAIMDSLPLLKWLGPLVGFVMFMIARGWPQPPRPGDSPNI